MTRDVKSMVLAQLAVRCERIAGNAPIGSATTLEQLDLDSLAVMELVYELEDQFNTTLDAASLPQLRTVGDVIVALNRSRKSAP